MTETYIRITETLGEPGCISRAGLPKSQTDCDDDLGDKIYVELPNAVFDKDGKEHKLRGYIGAAYEDVKGSRDPMLVDVYLDYNSRNLINQAYENGQFSKKRDIHLGELRVPITGVRQIFIEKREFTSLPSIAFHKSADALKQQTAVKILGGTTRALVTTVMFAGFLGVKLLDDYIEYREEKAKRKQWDTLTRK